MRYLVIVASTARSLATTLAYTPHVYRCATRVRRLQDTCTSVSLRVSARRVSNNDFFDISEEHVGPTTWFQVGSEPPETDGTVFYQNTGNRLTVTSSVTKKILLYYY